MIKLISSFFVGLLLATASPARLAGHWALDGNTADSKGAHDGAFEGTTAYTNGVIGQAALFDGAIDDVGVYSHALTAADIAAIYAAGLAGSNLATVAVSVPASEAVDFTACPSPLQVYPRDLDTDSAEVTVSGEVYSNAVDAVIVRVYRNDTLANAVTQSLVYADEHAPFDVKVSIVAETASYDFEVVLRKGAEETLVKRVEDVVAGDVLYIQGQSNAVAQMRSGDSANGNQHPYLRSFGRNSNNGATTIGDVNWYLAEGDVGLNGGGGGVGQWALRMGRVLIEETGIPLAIISGADGGKPISFFERNDANRTDLSTNYGRQLQRLRNAGVTDAIRAILWYQGESDGRGADVHEDGFSVLYGDWKEDFPNLERVYIQQIRTGCSVNDKWYVDLRDRQRRLPDRFPGMSVMSTTGVNAHDGCHYVYTGGYELIGNRNAALVAVDLYGSTNTANTTAPNVDYAYFTTRDRDEVKIVMRNQTDPLTFDAGAEADFRMENSAATVLSGVVSSNTVVLTFSGDASDGTGLTYGGHAGSGPWVTNAAGVGLLTFYNVPVALSIEPPATPSNFTATARNSTRIDLAWDDTYGTDSYILKRDGAVIAVTNATAFADTGLTAERLYAYAVTASNSFGVSAPAAASATTLSPPTDVPPAPTGLTARAPSPDTVALAWADVPEATRYHVRRDGTEIAVTSLTTYRDGGLSAQTAYDYSVAAENEIGLSPYSDVVTVVTPSHPVYGNVVEAADFQIVYELDIPNDGAFAGSTPVPYTIDRSALVTDAFARVAYYLELDRGTGTEWVYVSMDAFTDDARKVGLPHSADNPVKFQQLVTNVNVFAGGGAEARVVTSNGIATGNIEFWPSNYDKVDGAGIPGSDDATYDFGDGSIASTGTGYGSFQVHNYLAGQTVFAYNHWGSGGVDDLGIGNNTGADSNGNPDWTFMANAGDYTVKRLTILVSRTPLPRPTDLALTRISDTEVDLLWNAPTGAVSYIVRRNGVIVDEPLTPGHSETALQPATPYTWSVAAVYTNGTSSGATMAYTTTVQDVYDYVPEAAGYDIVYHLNLPADGDFQNATPVPYTIDRSASITGMTRVAYFLELDGPTDGREWVYVSMDAFTADPGHLGLPRNTLGYTIQQRVNNMNVFAGGAATGKVTVGTAIATGNMECWPNNYSAGNAIGIPGASGSAYDFGDTINLGVPVGHSCFQVHNYGAGETIFAYNKWGASGTDALGIGNNTGTAPNGSSNPDWTFMETADDYTLKSFVVLAKPVTNAPPHAPTGLAVATTGIARVDLVWDAVPDTATYLVLRNGEVAGETMDATYSDRDVQPGTDYAYCVAAANAFGPSAFCAPVRARTEPFTPAVFGNVPEANEYEIVYALDILDDASYRDGSVPDYFIDRSGSYILAFDRVAYYLELDGEWAYASMDAFTTHLNAIALPHYALGVSFQQNVSNLNVFAGGAAAARVTTGTNLATGNIEFWPNNYTQGADGVFNHDDEITATNPGYGSFQVHNHDANSPHTILAYNCWGNAGAEDLGIGNRAAANTDWTFAHNAASYAVKRLFVLVRANHDTDGDGLRDDWEMRNFHGLEMDGDDDPDGDGLKNIDERKAGTRPADSGSRVDISITCDEGDARLSFQTVTQHSYTVQYRTSLVHGVWRALDPSVTGTGEPSSVTDPSAVANRFYRLGVAGGITE